MRKILTFALAALLVACSPKQQTETKDMNQLSFTTEQAAWMSVIACDEAKGDLVALESAIHNGLEAELTVSQIKEALCLYGFSEKPKCVGRVAACYRRSSGERREGYYGRGRKSAQRGIRCS